jgi:penicillin-binding protein-related factor A (putative recombinase)
MTPEDEIKRTIMSWLWAKGIFSHEVYNGGTFNQKRGCYLAPRSLYRMKGVADIMGVLKGGRHLAIEVKTKTGRVSPEQKAYLEAVNENGGIGFVARSVDDVIRELGGSGYETD